MRYDFNPIDPINASVKTAIEENLLHLYTEDSFFDGRTIKLNNRNVTNFGSCSYMGLETDLRLKQAAIEAVERYGTQFSCSRTYISFTLYQELEALLHKMFGSPVLLASSTSLGHKAVIPIVTEPGDAAILDHFAHISMQEEVKKLQARDLRVIITRHNNLDELEDKIKRLQGKHRRIWYFMDGVYSMYGEVAPLEEIMNLHKRYPSLHLYIDDAHGMSWAGTHGTGYTLTRVKLCPRMIVASSLAKGFASAGGIFVFGDENIYTRVRTWGGPLTYSGPQQPAVIGASIASAKIHLTNEITERQSLLEEKINYCNKLFTDLALPLISKSPSPIFFLGLGTKKLAFNMIRRMLQDGFFLNLGIYPAVPETCAGLRFTLNLHHKQSDIRLLGEKLAEHLPLAMKEEGRTEKDIEHAFRIKLNKIKKIVPLVKESLSIRYDTSILSVEDKEWKKLEELNPMLSKENLFLFEKSFKGNIKEEESWDFHYYRVYDENKKLVLATVFTSVLIKEDLILSSFISRKIEKHRKDDPYFLCSKCFMMGTLLTEGDHLYIDRSHMLWEKALELLIDEVKREKEKRSCSLLYLRDFRKEDTGLQKTLSSYGFLELKMPPSLTFKNTGFTSKEDFIRRLQHRRRFHLKKDVLCREHEFELEVNNTLNEHIAPFLYGLYLQTKSRNIEINDFNLPVKLFTEICNCTSWEKLLLKLKGTDEIVAFVFSYNTPSDASYFPLLIGMNYNYPHHKVYKQMLFKTIIRGIELKKEQIFLGLTAIMEKRKLGADATNKIAYLQMDTNINQLLTDIITHEAI